MLIYCGSYTEPPTSMRCGGRRLLLHRESRLSLVEEVDDHVGARFEDGFSGESSEFDFDGVVLASQCQLEVAPG
jgi:hypothetical protein